MFSIADFFKRIQGVQAKEVFLRNAIKDSIKKHVGLEIPVEEIEVKSSTVNLKNVSSAARSAVFIKKGTILREINEIQQMRVITDVR